MSQQNKGTKPSAPAELPMKRKRGRPRKDESAVQGEKIPVISGSDSLKGNQHSEAHPSNDIDDDMVGQLVSGVLEGSFDAGYFLTVKVGNTDTLLRGVVFLPGKFTPITAANDVAPHAKLYKRKEILIPVVKPQIQLHSSMPQSEKNNRQPVQLEKQVPTFPNQGLGSEHQSGVPLAVENQSASVTTPLTGNMPRNNTGISLGGQVMPQQNLEFGLENQCASVVAPLEKNRMVEQDGIFHEDEDLTMIEEPKSGVEASKDLKLGPTSKTDVYMLPANETISQDPQVQHQAMNSDPKPNELVHCDVKSPNLELQKTPVVAEYNSLTPELSSKPIDILTGTFASPKNDIPHDIRSELAVKISSGDDTFHSKERLVSDANVTEAGSLSA
ncbi:hypothetical protein L1049_009736 [Liquidambar formosana]|uniref:AT hook motif-containing protein n=1 Tax=Liquidambar formosana TaxID=63359 RepID=A0AAP0R4A4_LIQFO